MATYYADLDRVIDGNGTSALPWTSTEMSQFLFGTTVDGHTIVNGDIIRIKGTIAESSSDYTFSAISESVTLTSWEDGIPWKVFGTNDYARMIFATSSLVGEVIVENAIIRNLDLNEVLNPFTYKNCIFYNNFELTIEQEEIQNFNGCLFIDAFIELEDYEFGENNETVNFNDCVFYETSAQDETVYGWGTVNVAYCRGTYSPFANLTSGTTVNDLGGNIWTWIPTNIPPAYDSITQDNLNFHLYGLGNISATRSSNWTTSGYDEGFYGSERIGAGAFDFNCTDYVISAETSYDTGMYDFDRLGPGAFFFNSSANDVSATADLLNLGIIIPEPEIWTDDDVWSVEKEQYITICGTRVPKNFRECRWINLRKYLPNYLRFGEIEDFVKVFEDYLNEMYYGYCGLSAVSVTDVSGTSALPENTVDWYWTDANRIVYDTSGNPVSASDRISILEKIYRLTELHDADLIDLDYINFFAQYLGYKVNINRGEIGLLSNIDTPGVSGYGCSAVDENEYIRFVVRNLPTWYKIKTTRNAVRVMLYSFGIIGDIMEYFTKGDATQNGYKFFQLVENDDLSVVLDDYYPSPHFAIGINLDESITNVSFDLEKRNQIISAIESIRPINTVFDRLFAFITRRVNMNFIILPPRIYKYVNITWQE